MLQWISVVVFWVDVDFCVFFFKQKTAYEMRISDWSSGVCSSDLQRARRAGRRLMPLCEDVHHLKRLGRNFRDIGQRTELGELRIGAGRGLPQRADALGDRKIGRAHV